LGVPAHNLRIAGRAPANEENPILSYRMPEAAARAEAARLNAENRPNRRYTAAIYDHTTDCPPNFPALERWGVLHEYQYADRPDLGWINGGFVWFSPRR